MKSIHVLFGNEPYLIEEKKSNIIHTVLNEEEMEFGVSIHDMRETPLHEAIEDAQTLSFLGGKRVVILKDSYFLTGEQVKKKIDHDVDLLQKYAEDPNEDTTLILTVSHDKLDGRKKVVKTLKKFADVFESKPLWPNQLYTWVQKCAKNNGVSITEESNNLLTNFIGSNLYSLEKEIQKMSVYLGGKGEITKSVVEELVSRTLEQDIFKLIDRIVHKDMKNSFDLLGDMFRQGEDPIKILNLLASQFRKIFQVNQLASLGNSQSQMAASLALHPYVVQIASNQAKEYKLEDLLNILSQLANLDFQMKTGRVDKHIALETFITRLV